MADPLPLLALFYSRAGESRLAEFQAVAQQLGAPPVAWSWDRRMLSTNGGDVGPRLVQYLPPLPAGHPDWLADAGARCVGCRGSLRFGGRATP